MIRSMTGFGSAKGCAEKIEITVEIKSVNNRYLDCGVKIPRMYAAFEETVKTVINGAVSRGKIDVSVYIDSSGADDAVIKANRSLAQAYTEALREIARDNNLQGDVSISDIARFPDILQASKREVDAERFAAGITAVTQEAADNLNRMREREGGKLKADMLSRLDEIEVLTDLAQKTSANTVPEYRKKLEERMNEVLQSSGIDEARILAEAAIFADKVAINEEIVRLRSHIDALRELIGQNEPVGRKIDFLVQELNREANTIGSKGNDAEMSRIVVDLKSEIEKIREQAQNVE